MTRTTLIAAIAAVVLALACVFDLRKAEPQRTGLAVPDTAAGSQIALTDKSAVAKEVSKLRRSLARLKPDRPFIVINTHDNSICLRTEDSVLLIARCSTGSGTFLQDSLTGRIWKFTTPHGIFRVTSKLEQPWWRKPDWVYVEENEPLPTNDQERLDPTMLGEYALGFGDGYFIHGTLYERLLGINVTHGCVRVGADDLKALFDSVRIGDRIYVF
jgi:L,D-transpeptidase YbiS